MLRLASESDPAWTAAAIDHLDEVLLDHAHCEKKAAGGALRLLFQYPQHTFLQQPLSELAREELTHFEALLAQLRRRGLAFGRQKPSAYGGLLRQAVRAREPGRLLDLLLVSSLIEARSCERMQRLAEALPRAGEAELARFYESLLTSEARHHGLYVELAARLAGNDAAQQRLGELSEQEARAIREPARLVRLHTGPLSRRGTRG